MILLNIKATVFNVNHKNHFTMTMVTDGDISASTDAARSKNHAVTNWNKSIHSNKSKGRSFYGLMKANNYLSLKQQATKLIEEEEYILAQNTLIKMQQISPHNYELLIAMGYVYENLEMFAAAQWYCRQAIKLQPKNDFGYFYLGKLYLNSKEYTKANEILIKCLSIDESKAVTNLYYGELLYKLYLVSIEETIDYLYTYATESKLNKVQKEYVNLCTHVFKNEKKCYDLRLSNKYKLKCI
eukprot:417316_1